MRIDLYIARRLRLSDNNGNRTKTSIRISTAGVVLSVVIMLITMAVTSGFKHEIVSKLIGFDSQITLQVSAADRGVSNPLMSDVDKVRSIISEVLPASVVEESMKIPAMLKTTDNFVAVVFRGYGGSGHSKFISSNIIEGVVDVTNIPDNGIIISSIVAGQLGLKVGDKVNTCFFADDRMRLRNFEIVAIFNSGFGEYDKTVAYAPLSALRKIANIDHDLVSELEVTGLEFESIAESHHLLQQALAKAYYSREISQFIEVDSILRSGAMYLNWLSLLDTNVIVILVLMTAISSFTLIASLIILILERVNMIGTLKMLGATNTMIRRIFIFLDLKVLIKGLLAGNLIALTLIFLQQQFQLLPLDAEAYYISFVPVKITLLQVLSLNVAAILLATIIMLLPSMIISRLKPAAILRYE